MQSHTARIAKFHVAGATTGKATRALGFAFSAWEEARRRKLPQMQPVLPNLDKTW